MRNAASTACVLIPGDFYTMMDTRLDARPPSGRLKASAGLGTAPQLWRLVHRV